MSEILDNHHNVQQNVMEILIDRSQLRRLAGPTIFPTEGGYPASSWITRAKLQLRHSLMGSLRIVAGGGFTAADS